MGNNEYAGIVESSVETAPQDIVPGEPDLNQRILARRFQQPVSDGTRGQPQHSGPA